MWECVQSQYTGYSILNWGFLVVPSKLWWMYHPTTTYPILAVHPGEKSCLPKWWRPRGEYNGLRHVAIKNETLYGRCRYEQP
jgi:hypothetical protein